MAKRSRSPMLTLEQQLAQHDDAAPPGPTLDVFGEHLEQPSRARIEWAEKRQELVGAIRRRDAKRSRDPGPIGGKYDVSPASARGHVVKVAPKELRSNGESQFPKRITTQRVIDRYRVRGHISVSEWQAANELWELWNDAQLEARVTSGYEPVTTGGSPSQDHKIAKRVDSAGAFLDLMEEVPYRSRGVVRAVVIEDWTASDWAKLRGFTHHDSERHGLDRLRAGLQGLAEFLGY